MSTRRCALRTWFNKSGPQTCPPVRDGTIGVNSASFPMEAPFGGMKNSGIGRELGPGGLDAYLESKTIFRGC
ncbi:aldehyde dehydrogenase family protein [Nocardia cyriacigeorgica]|uniref:aldehyde dehydrogenase family protein n=1 Tax=Nocardia cyriacigeorgica TaxID=135487 RepID=UPI00273EF2A8|nr:aldehyde dehydrogenase family protein [Nocardia cyriacigeorgica]